MRCTVTGRVQGVFFRASTREQAQALGLTGYAINRDDGSVEVLACGEASALESLRRWLHEGPPGAHVVRVAVDSQALPEPVPTKFRVG